METIESQQHDRMNAAMRSNDGTYVARGKVVNLRFGGR
jgi:hypothetical protein